MRKRGTSPPLPAPPFLLHSVPLTRSPRGWQKSRSGRLVISHFPKQRHRQAAALPPDPPVPRHSLFLFLSLSLPLLVVRTISLLHCILSRCFVPLRVPSIPVAARCSSLSLLLSFSLSPQDSVPLSHHVLSTSGHPSCSPPSRSGYETPRPGAVSLPSRRAPSAVASRRSRLLPSRRETPSPSPRLCSPPLLVLSLSRVYLD